METALSNPKVKHVAFTWSGSHDPFDFGKPLQQKWMSCEEIGLVNEEQTSCPQRSLPNDCFFEITVQHLPEKFQYEYTELGFAFEDGSKLYLGHAGETTFSTSKQGSRSTVPGIESFYQSQLRSGDRIGFLSQSDATTGGRKFCLYRNDIAVGELAYPEPLDDLDVDDQCIRTGLKGNLKYWPWVRCSQLSEGGGMKDAFVKNIAHHYKVTKAPVREAPMIKSAHKKGCIGGVTNAAVHDNVAATMDTPA